MAYPKWMHKRIIGRRCRHCGQTYIDESVYGTWITIGDAGRPTITIATRCLNVDCTEFHAVPMPVDRHDVMDLFAELYRRSENIGPAQYIHRDHPSPCRKAVEPMVPSITPIPLSPIEPWEIRHFQQDLSSLDAAAGSPAVRDFLKKLAHRRLGDPS